MSEEVTQSQVDEIFVEAKAEWHRMVEESGHSEAVFMAVSSEATQFLASYHYARTEVEAAGLTMPDLVPGLKITVDGE